MHPVIRPILFSATAMLSAFGLVASAVASAQTSISPAERRMELAAPPDEILLFGEDSKQVVDYKSDRIIRICVTDNRHLVPLTVIHDGERTNVAPGDCTRIEAREVTLTPAERLDDPWAMRAEVETLT